MRNCLVLALIVCFPIASFAEKAGIENRNYNIGVSGSGTEHGNSYALLAIARTPVAAYTGMFLSGNASAFKGKSSYLDSTSQSVGVGVFFRKYKFGTIGASYGYTKMETDAGAQNIKGNINTVSLNSALYIKNVDLAFVGSKATPNTGNNVVSAAVGVSSYFSDNFRAGVSVGGMDAAGSSSVNVIYQPAILSNVVSISATYTNASSIDTLSLSLNYYYGSKVTLIDRARRY